MTIEHEDHLLNRIVDAEESTSEWNAFAIEADRSPRLWRELAIQQREARLLDAAIDASIAGAGRGAQRMHGAHAVDGELVLRDRAGVARGPAGALGERRSRRVVMRSARRSGWTGWALAACLVGAWIVGRAIPDARPGAGAVREAERGGDIAVASFASPEDAFQAYLDRGREEGTVVGEVKGRPVVERRELENGEGFEVLVVRQVIERRRVPTFYDFGREDERGVPLATPIAPRRGGSL